ncbi:hypothetical protein Pint_25972 [Pistacia integerrima]|uniref:Uncharacterized protein n=1 Tax=Pistacia integerrima TaxID=434235 RepID=A0ACC0YC96_9ROSI|nr:hypothetical protein Pint_25972 [Pistacia integerrima]
MGNRDSKGCFNMGNRDSKGCFNMGNRDSKGLIRRHASPSHYLFKMDSFSFRSKALADDFISDTFVAGGYRWQLIIYLSGDWIKAKTNYISVQLELLHTSSLQIGWEVNMIFNFFLFNQLKEKYFSLQDGSVKQLQEMKTKWGIKNFIDLNTFSDPLNGYLINDSCVFGAEVFVVGKTFKGDHLSLIKNYDTLYHTWKNEKFSTLLEEYYESESFGFYKWNVSLYPNGDGPGKGNSISLFLNLPGSSVPQDMKLLVMFTMSVKDQLYGKHVKRTSQSVYKPSDKVGFHRFMALEQLKNPKKGFLVDDTLIIEVEVKLVGVVTKLST